jgi:exodeoxyribonuclease III
MPRITFVDIFYHIATPALAAKAKKAEICKARRFSDHAPLTISYDI